MAGAAHFSTMDFKSGFWQVKMVPESQQYTAFTMGNWGLRVYSYALWALQCSYNFSASHAEHLGGTELDILCHLFG